MKLTFDFRARADALDVAETFAIAGWPHTLMDKRIVIQQADERLMALITAAIEFAPVQITVE